MAVAAEYISTTFMIPEPGEFTSSALLFAKTTLDNVNVTY